MLFDLKLFPFFTFSPLPDFVRDGFFLERLPDRFPSPSADLEDRDFRSFFSSCIFIPSIPDSKLDGFERELFFFLDFSFGSAS